MPDESLSLAGNGEVVCPMCKNPFKKIRHQIYCSKKCRWDAWLQKKVKNGVVEVQHDQKPVVIGWRAELYNVETEQVVEHSAGSEEEINQWAEDVLHKSPPGSRVEVYKQLQTLLTTTYGKDARR